MPFFKSYLVLLLLVAEIFVTEALVRSENVAVTFPTPLEELIRIETHCQDKWGIAVSSILAKHQECLVKAGVPVDEDQIESKTQFPCDKLSSRHNCWEETTRLIDACIPHRGQTVRSIYMTFLDISCQNEEKLRKLKASGKLCPVQPTLSKFCKDTGAMTSPDLCRSFTAQKLCEESDFSTCRFEEHKELLQNHLQKITLKLNCTTGQGTGKGVVTDHAKSFAKNLQFSLLYSFIVLITSFVTNLFY